MYGAVSTHHIFLLQFASPHIQPHISIFYNNIDPWYEESEGNPVIFKDVLPAKAQ